MSIPVFVAVAPLVWLAVSTLIYVLIYRKARPQGAKHAALAVGLGAILGPGIFLGHGIALAPAGFVVLAMIVRPNIDAAVATLVLNSVLWAVTTATFLAAAWFLRRRQPA